MPAVEGENDYQKDLVKKEDLLAERHALEERFDAVTRAWVKVASGKSDPERDEIAQELREQYARLSPYIHTVNPYQRWGVSVNGQVNWIYNVKNEAEALKLFSKAKLLKS